MKKSLLTSPFATQVDRPRDVRDQKLPAKRFVVHITGRQTYLNALRNRIPPIEWLAQNFCMPNRNFTQYGIDPWGQLWQFAPDNERPWAQGYKELKDQVLNREIEPPDWWHAYWIEQNDDGNIWHPADLLIDGEKSPNSRTGCVELIQWNKSPKKQSNFKLTMAQYIMCHTLAHDFAARHSFRLETDWPNFNICGHEDLNPWSRGTKAGGWDPGAHRVNGKPRFCWRCLETLDFTHDGEFELCPSVIPTPPRPKWAIVW
jgi:hypothetical protein